ncbi:MalY/PatB family protein [Paenibacillus albus]|uniref:cysteine-S-conjugate beta-lyase n=1 Tax=Paenibacillus albus TaxID=2495582 RepID=A0A3Q8X6B6_9BACL|nr:MalY/PatB family protein [Paenibacillus albus]AZN41178.1 pyridoxal phosphate-dependent aminotransferase [Paenibacillus albus]
MRYDFARINDRRNSSSFKWDGLAASYGPIDDAIPMWVADMDFASPPEVVEALQKRARHGIFGYSFRPDSYLEAITDWLERRHQWRIDPAWIAHSPDVIAALSILIETFTKQGDKIIYQAPVYNFARIIENQGRIAVNNPLRYAHDDYTYTMDLDGLEAMLELDQTFTMLILCSPHNPIGRVWQREELERLGRICVKYNLLVVSDEIHCDLVHEGNKHIPISSISAELAAHSFTCIAPSKTFNLLSMHAAAVIIPNEALRAQYNQALKRLGLDSPNTFGSIALETAYREGEGWLNELLIYLKGNIQLITEFFEARIPQIRIIQPEGTYLIWLDCSELERSCADLELFFAHKARVILQPGLSFGEEGAGFMRMNAACPRSVLEEAMRRIEAALQEIRD